MSKKDVLITGASGTIGGTIAKSLARADFNLHLAVRDKSRLERLDKELVRLGATVFDYPMNLRDSSSCEKTCQEFFKNAENPFALVSAAGNLAVPGKLLDVDFQSWSDGFTENFMSHIFLVRCFSSEIVKNKIADSRVVLFSGAGVGGNGSFANVTSYGAAKAALAHMAEALGEELSPHGIKINAVAPGAVLSAITDQAIKAGIERIGNYASSALECKKSGGVSPDLAAELVNFLLSDNAHQISGRLLSARFDQKVLREDPGAVAKDRSLFRLRRIDSDLFGASK